MAFSYALDIATVRLKNDGFVVLDSFLSRGELDQLQMEAALVLEASGAYDADACDPGGCGYPSMAATESRGCIYEVTRPLGHSGGQAYPAAPAGAEGVRTAPARPTSQHAPCASVQLPSLGLLASPKLLALMEAVFGFTGPCGGAGGSWSQSAGGPVADQQLPHCIAEVSPAAPQHHSDGTGGCPAPAALDTSESGSADTRGMNNRDAATAMHHRHHRRNDNNNLSQRQASGDGTGNGDSACGSSSSSSSSCRPRYPTSAGAAGPLLFNEQFILKPPRSAYSSAFAWHRDSDWCRDSSTYDYSPYVSLWVALDDMTQDNGALAVLPGSHVHMQPRCSSSQEQPLAAAAAPSARGDAACHSDTPRQGTAPAPAPAQSRSSHPGQAAPGQGHAHGSSPGQEAAGCGAPASCAPVQLHVPAGTAVLFWDTLLHASGPNTSRHTRRAWMPQFCSRPITRLSDGQPVALAVPLRSLVAPEGS